MPRPIRWRHLPPMDNWSGLARTFQNPQPEDEVRCFLMLEVHPSQRASGLEDALLDWAKERGRQRLLLASNVAARVLCFGIQDTQTAAASTVGTARLQHRALLLSHAARSN